MQPQNKMEGKSAPFFFLKWLNMIVIVLFVLLSRLMSRLKDMNQLHLISCE